MLPEPVDPGENERTFDAGIFIVSFGGALGLDKSFAFLRVKPSVIRSHLGEAVLVRYGEIKVKYVSI